MAQATVAQDRRQVRAAGIVEAHTCELQDDGRWLVRDAVTGSGRPHVVAGGRCDCADFLYRGSFCKHLRAVEVEERALAHYCAEWNATALQQREVMTPAHTCPDCGSPVEPRQAWIGGKGWTYFLVCLHDEEHRAQPA